MATTMQSEENDSLDISQLRIQALGSPLSKEVAQSRYSEEVLTREWELDELGFEVPILQDSPILQAADTQYAQESQQLGPPSRHGFRLPYPITKPKMNSSESQQSGGTQVLSQWMLESKESHITARQGADNTRNTTTYTTGDTGHVDLVSRFEPPAIDSATQDGDIGATQQDVHTELFPEERRFKLPETPAQNARTRNPFEVNQTTPQTPQLPTNPFARHATQNNLAMGLSQVFNATQAPSSPTAALLPAVPSSDRPSPGLQIANVHELPSDIATDPTSPVTESMKRPRTAPSLSASSQPSRTPLQRAITQPHTKYISRQVSQEERKKRAQTETVSSPIAKDDEIADKLFSDETEVTQSNKRRRTRQGFQAVASSITAPPRSIAQTNIRSQRAGVIRSNPINQNEPPVIDISDGPIDSSEEETEPEDVAHNASSDSEDDNYDEDKENRHANRVQVQTTGVAVKRKQHTYASRPPSSPSLRRSTRPSEQEHLENGVAVTRNSYLSKSLSQQPTKTQLEQPITIADSQASQKRSEPSGSAPNRGGALSSSNSKQVVLQSQMLKVSSNPELKASGAQRRVTGSSQQSLTPPPSSPPKETEGYPSLIQSPIRSTDLVDELVNALGSSPPMLKGEAMTLGQVSAQVEVEDDEQVGHEDGATEMEVTAESSNVMIEETSPVAVNSDTDIRNKPSSLSESSRTPSSRINRLPSTVPETLSHGSLELSLLKEATLMHDNVEESIAKKTTRYNVAQGQGLKFLQPASESPTQARTRQSHREAGSQSKSKSSVPTTPTRASPRKPRPFTSIAAEVRSPDQSSANEVVNLFVEGLEFQEQMDALDSSPIGPAKKRKRRNVMSSGSSSVVKPAVSPKSSEVAHLSKVPTSQQEDELARGPDVSNLITRRASVSRVVNTRAQPQPSRLPRRGEEAVQVVTELNSPEPSKAKEKPESHATIVGAKALPIAEHDTHRARSLVSEHIDPKMVGQASSSDRTNLRVQTMMAPFRVFAMWKGSPQAFFPATCLGPSSGSVEHTYKVQWDDGSVTETNGQLLRRLELQNGDIVKVDNRKGQAYTVVGFQRGSSRGERSSDVESSLTDIFGNSQVELRAKRKMGSADQEADEIVAIKDLYLTKSLWSSTLKGREYTHPPSALLSSGSQTPIDALSTPSTPQSRSRTAKLASNLFTHQRASHGPRPNLHQTSNLFNNIIFAMTSVGSARDQVQSQISNNGGTLLSETFAELFDTPAPERFLSNTPPSRSSTPPPSARSSNGPSFTLKSIHNTARFAVLLADSHCRTTKYFEALALGIPCIHSRWVSDCVKASKLLDWRPYLLPSGESMFLYDAVCSRSLSFDYNGGYPVALSEMVDARGKWLNGARVLLVKSGGKKSEKIMDAYVFIAYTLGAEKIGVAQSRAEAERVLKRTKGKKDEEWDWICLYEEEEKGGGSRKRKRGRSLNGSGATGGGAMLLPSAEVEALGKWTHGRVVGTEFVVQSLILGRLFDA